MQAFGAQVTDVLSDKNKITEKLIKEMIETSRKISQRPAHWWADQLNNHDAVTGYYSLGEEIWNQTGGRIDAFVHAVGTAHSLHGVTKVPWQHNPKIHISNAFDILILRLMVGGEGGLQQNG